MVEVALGRGYALVVERVRHPPRHALALELDPPLDELEEDRTDH